MKINNKIKVIIMGCLFVAFLCGHASAQGPESSVEKGFSGYLSPISGMVNTSSNFYAFEGTKFAIDDLNNELEDEINQGFFSIIGEVSYQFEGGQRAYLGVPFDERNPRRFSLDEGISLGIVQPLRDYGRIDFSVYFSKEMVWENPYLTGETRTEKEMYIFGFMVKDDGVGGTNLNVLYKMKLKGMEGADDVIGNLYPDLEREGFIHTLETEYDFLFGRQYMLTPGFTLEKGDMEGKSNSYEGYFAKLIYTWDRDSIILNSSISAGGEIYDKTHPLFNKRRKDSVFSAGTGITLLGNLGFKNVFVHCNLNLETRQSNIDFCDAEKVTSFIAVGYNF